MVRVTNVPNMTLRKDALRSLWHSVSMAPHVRDMNPTQPWGVAALRAHGDSRAGMNMKEQEEGLCRLKLKWWVFDTPEAHIGKNQQKLSEPFGQ